MNKYHAERVFKYGRWFDSKYESSIYPSLQALENAGKIWDLQCQVKFRFVVNGRYIGFYRADYTFKDAEGFHVLEVKGYKTDLYSLKKRLFEALYPYTIEEV